MLDLGDRIGTLDPGKDADFVVLSGPPFSVYTHVLETWIEGQKVFDRSNPQDLRYATGGFGVAIAFQRTKRETDARATLVHSARLRGFSPALLAQNFAVLATTSTPWRTERKADPAWS